MNTKMSRAEKFVAGLAAAVLVTGFAVGGSAKPMNTSLLFMTDVVSFRLNRSTDRTGSPPLDARACLYRRLDDRTPADPGSIRQPWSDRIIARHFACGVS